MKIEYLYPEVGNLFGESQNINYLCQCLPNAELVNTSLNEKPHFIDNDVSLVYMGAMTEKSQITVIHHLREYKDIIAKKIESGQVFLCTGNSFEVFFNKLINKTDNTINNGLGIFDFNSEINLFKRFNGKILGEFEDIEIIGFQSQFSRLYGDNSENYFIKCIRGSGLNTDTKLEGIHQNNFFATSLLGPFLIMNPLFTKKLIAIMGIENNAIAFEEAALNAYFVRLAEFKEKRLKF